MRNSAGPVSDVRISGRMQVGDIHRWDLLPPYGDNWSLDYHGRLDLVSQRLELEMAPLPGGEALPLSLRVRASGYLGVPVWGILATLDRLPLAPLPQVGRHMGMALPRDLVLDWQPDRRAGVLARTGLQGKLVARETGVKMPDSPAIRLERAELVFEGGRVMLSPTAFRLPAARSGCPLLPASHERRHARIRRCSRPLIPGRTRPWIRRLWPVL